MSFGRQVDDAQLGHGASGRSDFWASLWQLRYMKFMGQLSRDRVSARAIALLISYFLVLQGLLGALAQSAMAASLLDPLHVICTSSGASILDTKGQGDLPQKNAPDCPCASLCRLASGSTPAVLEAHPGLPVVVQSEAIEIYAVRVDLETPSLRGLIGEPRAPPTPL